MLLPVGCATSSSLPCHISLRKYMSSCQPPPPPPKSQVILSIWFGLVWQSTNGSSDGFRPMRRELTKVDKSKLSAVQDPEPLLNLNETWK